MTKKKKKLKLIGKNMMLYWDRDSIKRVKLHPDSRPTRPKQIKTLIAMLNRGEHWESNMVMNLNTSRNTYTIIDGQHRYRAAQEYLSNNPDRSIPVPAIVYKNMDLPEMNNLYKKHNKMIKQTLNDRLKMERKDLKIVDRILKNFPVKIGIGSKVDGWALSRLLRAYFNRNNIPESEIRSGQDQFMNAVKALTNKDYSSLVEFCTAHQDVFGRPSWDNAMCGVSGLNVLMKIWFFNIEKMKVSSATIVHRFKRLRADSQFIQLGKQMNRQLQRQLYDYAIDKMNGRRGKPIIHPIPKGKTV